MIKGLSRVFHPAQFLIALFKNIIRINFFTRSVLADIFTATPPFNLYTAEQRHFRCIIKNTHLKSGQKNNYSVCCGGDGGARIIVSQSE